jgi:hypothetical protein
MQRSFISLVFMLVVWLRLACAFTSARGFCNATFRQLNYHAQRLKF